MVLFEVLQVVAACHRRGVCHGDIKPANFLMARKPVRFSCSTDHQWPFSVVHTRLCHYHDVCHALLRL